MSPDRPDPRPRYLDDPKVWRERAEEIRVIGESMANAKCRTTMLGIAFCYDLEAVRTEQRLKVRQYVSEL